MPKGTLEKSGKETERPQETQQAPESSNTNTSTWAGMRSRWEKVKGAFSTIDEKGIDGQIRAINDGRNNEYNAATDKLRSEYQSIMNVLGTKFGEEINTSYTEHLGELRKLNESQRKQFRDVIADSFVDARISMAYRDRKPGDPVEGMQYYKATQFMGDAFKKENMEAEQRKAWQDLARKQVQTIADFKATLLEKPAKDAEEVTLHGESAEAVDVEKDNSSTPSASY